jgi:hypothetical protein
MPCARRALGMPRAVGALLTLVLAACGPASPTATGLLDRPAAINAAMATAALSRPEVSGALVTPTLVRAEQLSLAEALEQFGGGVPAGYDPNMPVWLVELEGQWRSEVVAPEVTPPPTPALFSRFIVILDAATGHEIQSSLGP